MLTSKTTLFGALLATCLSATAAERNYVLPNNYDPAKSPPFSLGVDAAGTFYVAGHLGLDPATGQVPSEIDTELKLLLDGVKATLAKAGLGMDDLVSVTIYCSDLSLYDKFNAAYKTYFHDHYPSRAFIGAGSLLRGAHFEIQAIAVKGKPSAKK